MNFSGFLLPVISSFITLQSENLLDKISIFLTLLRLVVEINIYVFSLLTCSVCMYLRIMCIPLLLGRIVPVFLFGL